jgi:hypothetical protein
MSGRTRHRARTLATLLAVAALTSCSGSGSGVAGTVTMGGDPAAGLTVQLMQGGSEQPTPDTSGTIVAEATTDASGGYSLDADPGGYSLAVQDIEMEGTGGCTVLVPSVTVEDGSTLTLDVDVPTEAPSNGITFVDPFWFACYAA